MTSDNVTEKAKLVLAVGWAVDHFPYHLTLLKLAPHHFWVRVGNVKRCRPKLFFGALGVTDEPTTVLGPRAQPTGRTSFALLKIPTAPKKKIGSATSNLYVADPNSGSVQCALERKCT